MSARARRRGRRRMWARPSSHARLLEVPGRHSRSMWQRLQRSFSECLRVESTVAALLIPTSRLHLAAVCGSSGLLWLYGSSIMLLLCYLEGILTVGGQFSARKPINIQIRACHGRLRLGEVHPSGARSTAGGVATGAYCIHKQGKNHAKTTRCRAKRQQLKLGIGPNVP